MVQKAKKGGKKQVVKFTINCSEPVSDNVLDVASFEKFLHDRIKVNGKAGLSEGDSVSVSRDANRDCVFVTAELPFSKR